MNILLTNDDGYQSEALQQICAALSALPNIDVYVVAPDSQRSACSHSIVFMRQITFQKLNEYYGAKIAYISGGTPANCTNFGLTMLGVNMDMVISGPNIGPNCGYDILYSGTVGGAQEATLKGVRGIALSRSGVGGNFGPCIDFVVDNLHKLYSFNKPNTLININVPDIAKKDIQGVVVVGQSASTLYDDHYVHCGDNLYSLQGEPILTPSCNDDITMCSKGYIVVTPLTLIRTDKDSIEQVKELFKE